jgi:hypothetical protein
MVTPLAVAATPTEMSWRTTTFRKGRHTAFPTVGTTVRNQHAPTLDQDRVDVRRPMGPHLLR